ncbi:DUF218 domain-containing protein [Sordaria sp. MPI-SDFR-AT-0083]|nr:DUF218 domain-containing protein [Sordaria sp. MPI-SDFR-AT-0083]
MSPEQHEAPDGVPTHRPASSGPSLPSTVPLPAPAATTAPSTIPVPAPTDMLGIPTTTTPNIATTTTTSTTSTPAPKKKATPEEIDNWARTIYNYHRMHMPLPTFPPSPSQDPSEDRREEPTRIIFTLCSLDLRVAHYAAHLFLTTFLPAPSPTQVSEAPPRRQQRAYKYLLFSGHSGLLTRSLTGDPSLASSEDKIFQSEASLFASIALSLGVPSSCILIEEQSTNTGENVRFTHALLQHRGIQVDEFLLVQKPYMERRTWGTFGAQWPSLSSSFSQAGKVEEGEVKKVEFSVTSPPLEWEEYPDEKSGDGRELMTNIMVGDLVRLKEYGERGWQTKMEIPPDVWEAGRRLVEDGGFGGHLPEGFQFSGKVI